MSGENHRQEIEIPFGGKVYAVRPSLDAIIGVEAATNQSCLTLAGKCYRGDVSLTELSSIVHALLKPVGGPASARDVAQTLFDEGFQDLREPVADILARALRGNKEHEKEAAEKVALAKVAGEAAKVDPQEG